LEKKSFLCALAWSDRKNIEVHTNRRFKRQGREGAEHLAQLLWLQTHRKIGPTGGTKLP
jgi:hypothetical protein